MSGPCRPGLTRPGFLWLPLLGHSVRLPSYALWRSSASCSAGRVWRIPRSTHWKEHKWQTGSLLEEMALKSQGFSRCLLHRCSWGHATVSAFGTLHTVTCQRPCNCRKVMIDCGGVPIVVAVIHISFYSLFLAASPCSRLQQEGFWTSRMCGLLPMQTMTINGVASCTGASM